jgi:hypothetical protein
MNIFNETHRHSGIISTRPDNTLLYGSTEKAANTVAATLNAAMSVGDLAIYKMGRKMQFVVLPGSPHRSFFYKPADNVVVCVSVVNNSRIIRWIYTSILTVEKMHAYRAAIEALVSIVPIVPIVPIVSIIPIEALVSIVPIAPIVPIIPIVTIAQISKN